MTHAFTSYELQFWRDGTCRHDFGWLSIDAARHVATIHAVLGDTVRLLAKGEDYCEVYEPNGSVRRGTFAETTMVRV